jgi:hypothetical protein
MTAQAQSTSALMGANAMSVGYASACRQDEWALHNNIAGLAKIDQPVAAFSYDSRPSFPAFNRMAALFAMPIKPGVAGIGMYRFGDNLYSEQILSTGFANQFGLASLGIKVNCIQYQAQGFGTAQAFTISFGGIATLTPQLSVGAHIVNINQPKLSELTGETIPTRMMAGLGFKPSDNVQIMVEAEKDIGYRLLWKTGMEYKIHRKFLARTGFNLYPTAGFFGAGFKPKRFSFDYALQYTNTIGIRHQASVSYNFKVKP